MTLDDNEHSRYMTSFVVQRSLRGNIPISMIFKTRVHAYRKARCRKYSLIPEALVVVLAHDIAHTSDQHGENMFSGSLQAADGTIGKQPKESHDEIGLCVPHCATDHSQEVYLVSHPGVLQSVIHALGSLGLLT